MDKPDYDAPKIFMLDVYDEAKGGEEGYCSPGSGAEICFPTGAAGGPEPGTV